MLHIIAEKLNSTNLKKNRTKQTRKTWHNYLVHNISMKNFNSSLSSNIRLIQVDKRMLSLQSLDNGVVC